AGRRQCPNSVPNRGRTNENGPFPHVRARHDDGTHRAAARAEAAVAGRLVPAFCTLSQTVAARGDRLRRARTACEMDARGSSLRARFHFLCRGSHHRAALPPRRLRIGSPEPGDEQEGAWPRERLEAMVELLERAIERGEERPPMHRSAEAAV